MFTIEWCLRIRRADDWRKYLFTFLGVTDTLAILPLWLFARFDLKALRAFRLFRLFRSTTRLAGRSRAVAKVVRAFAVAKDGAGVVLAGTGVMILTAGLGMYHLEHDAQPAVFASGFDGLWWAVITLTTVGYGDVCPVTAGRSDPGNRGDVRRHRSDRRGVRHHGRRFAPKSARRRTRTSCRCASAARLSRPCRPMLRRLGHMAGNVRSRPPGVHPSGPVRRPLLRFHGFPSRKRDSKGRRQLRDTRQRAHPVTASSARNPVQTPRLRPVRPPASCPRFGPEKALHHEHGGGRPSGRGPVRARRPVRGPTGLRRRRRQLHLSGLEPRGEPEENGSEVGDPRHIGTGMGTAAAT